LEITDAISLQSDVIPMTETTVCQKHSREYKLKTLEQALNPLMTNTA